jgi:FlaA1/EpsC-like NDP-sugar epimerase
MKNRKIVIVGAGTAGVLLAKDIKRNFNSGEVIGFVDDTRSKKTHILGKIKDLPKLVQDNSVDEVVIAIPSAKGELVREILLNSKDSNIPIKIVPRDIRVLNKDRVRYADIKAVSVNDFLGRPIIKRNLNKVKDFYKNEKVLVTGGGGSIGSEIVWQLIELGAKQVIVLDHAENACFNITRELREQGVGKRRYQVIVGSVLNKKKVEQVMKRYKPNIVFHAAAYKHVGLMQDNVDEAVHNNVFGTKIVLDAAIKYGIKRFIFVSTDKVVNPTSVMGASKKIAEYYVQSVKPKDTIISIVRFGNVINSQGSVLPIFEEQIDNYRYVTLTDRRMKRFFMSIREAAELVIMSGTRSVKKAVYVLDMGDLISLYEVTRCLIRSKGMRPGIDVEERIIGKRPGEKLEEELFTDRERKKMRKTNMPNIYRLESDVDIQKSIDEIMKSLSDISNNGKSHKEVTKYLGELFPTLNDTISK